MAGKGGVVNAFGARSYEVRVVGARAQPLRDVYHAFMRRGWGLTLGSIAIAFLCVNAAFALVYLEVGGIAHAHPGSVWDAFFFSVQTMGTIGYGAMYPVTVAANDVVVAESVVGLVLTALSTGLVFAKFSRITSRIAFSRNATISLMDGVPTLMFRVGNERTSAIVEATLQLSLVRSETTAEGMRFYRLYDLALVRHRSPAMSRSWTVLHRIDAASPLYGATPESLEKDETELIASVAGIDDVALQTVHARYTYEHVDIVWGARLADVLHEDEHGDLVLDVRKFHDVVRTEPSDAFPYPREEG